MISTTNLTMLNLLIDKIIVIFTAIVVIAFFIVGIIAQLER